MATTAFCNSAKVELLEGTHCLFATQSGLAGAGVSTAFTITGLTTTAGLALGMVATGTNIAAGAIIASIDSATQVTVSKAHTGTVTSGTIAFTGDVLKMLLLKVGAFAAAGTQSNVGTPGTGTPGVTNVGTDEVAAGGGYTSGGTTLTNVTPTLVSTTAITNFSPNPNWTSATFSAIAAIIYNTTVRQGSANGITPNASGSGINRSISVHDFGGTQTVTSGTFTVVMPTADASNAILRIA
jgi:hypothetical protein